MLHKVAFLGVDVPGTQFRFIGVPINDRRVERDLRSLIVSDEADGFVQRCANPELEEYICVKRRHVTEHQISFVKISYDVRMDKPGARVDRADRLVLDFPDGRIEKMHENINEMIRLLIWTMVGLGR